MEHKFEEKLQLLPGNELELRLGKVVAAMTQADIDGVLVSDNANLFYLTGRIFCGYIYVGRDSMIRYFLRRPSVLTGADVHRIRKPEDMATLLADLVNADTNVGFTVDDTPYSTIQRLCKAIGSPRIANGSAVLRAARSVKTPMEVKLIVDSGMRLSDIYRRLPHLYREGMTDIELQIEIERVLRLHGCLGKFPVSGPELEIFMGNVLTGDNADAPSPYDFAMGGAGLGPSLPVGANGTVIRPGKPVMVDMNANFDGYLADSTRCYITGDCPEEARRANELSRRICEAIADAARPGMEARKMYELALSMVVEAGMTDFFMGHRSHAGFVGHGIGITVNELPVLAPRSRDVFAAGNVIAVEPKFVLPGIGAVGIENSYEIMAEGPARRLTDAPEDISSLD